MAVHIGLHVHDKRGESIQTSSQFLTDIGEAKAECVVVKLRVGADTVDLFLDNITDVDRLAFEFETLSRSLRDEHGWTEKENSK